jgi:hypothetical protein
MFHQAILVFNCLAAGTFYPAAFSGYVLMERGVTLVLL